MKVGAYCGLFILLLFSLIFFIQIYTSLNPPSYEDDYEQEIARFHYHISMFFSILNIVIACLSIFFYYGFVKLGKFTKSRLLDHSSYFMISIILLLIISLLFGFYESYLDKEWDEAFGYPFFLFVFSILPLFIIKPLFFISLINIRNEVKWSNIAGIVGLLIPVVFFILPFLDVDLPPFLSKNFYYFMIYIIYIFETIVLFKAAKKFEK